MLKHVFRLARVQRAEPHPLQHELEQAAFDIATCHEQGLHVRATYRPGGLRQGNGPLRGLRILEVDIAKHTLQYFNIVPNPRGFRAKGQGMEQHLRIGEIAEAVGVNPKTIRFYEEAGILPEARRSEQGWRRYGHDDVARLRFVRGARSIGLGLDEIRRFLELRERGEPACEHVLASIDRQLVAVDRQIAELGQLRSDLKQLHVEGLARTHRCPGHGRLRLRARRYAREVALAPIFEGQSPAPAAIHL